MKANLYFVGYVKNGCLCHLASGPFFMEDAAGDSADELNAAASHIDKGRYKVVTTQLDFTEVTY